MAQRRKSGSGTVRQRKDGRWEGRIVTHYDEKGLPKTKSVLAKTKSECQIKLKVLRESLVAKEPSVDKLEPDMLFGDWMKIWYEDYSKPKLRPATQSGYESAIQLHIIPNVGHIPIKTLTVNDLQQFYNRTKTEGRKRMADYYGEGLSNRTVRIIHALCHMALDKAVTEGLIRINPAANCKPPSKETPEIEVLTHEELQRFFIQAKEEGYYELFLLELATGLRRGELLALQWDDLNLTTGELKIDKQVTRINGKLTVSPPKTKAGNRTIIIPPAVGEVLLAHRKNTTSRWIFPSTYKEDAPLDPSWVRKKLQRILAHAECKAVRFHALRHTFATNALSSGMDIKTLSTVIGHVSAVTTLDTYAHSTDAMQRQAAVNIDRGIGKVSPMMPTEDTKVPTASEFQPYKGTRRKAGTGCVSQINDNLWEGRYSPKWIDGKKHLRTVYAKTEGDCEILLADLITEMKTELATLKAQKPSA